jgi:hypothetical protein
MNFSGCNFYSCPICANRCDLAPLGIPHWRLAAASSCTSRPSRARRGGVSRTAIRFLVLVPRSSSLPSRRASFLRSAFSVPSRIDRFEGVDQPGAWGEDRSSTTAFGYRDLEPSLPFTRNGNDTGKAHRHIIAVYVGHIAQARQIGNRSGDVFDRSGTMFEAARRRLRGLSSGRATAAAKY